jgi:methionine sulfoxide reductase heme-binding subunit
MLLRGWQIVGAAAVLLLILITANLLQHEFTEEFVRIVIRITARCSVALFLLAFTASSLRALWPTRLTAWQLQNRRYLGVAFAVSHFTHLAALFTLGACFPRPFIDELNAVTLVGGGLAYLFLTLMTITSFVGPRRAIGERAWKILHTLGSYYIWLIFLNSYLSRALVDISYAPYAVALLLALAARIAFWSKRRSGTFRERAAT